MRFKLTGLGAVFGAVCGSGVWFWFKSLTVPALVSDTVALIIYALMALGFSQITTMPRVRWFVCLVGILFGVAFYYFIPNMGIAIFFSAIAMIGFGAAEDRTPHTEEQD